ncbi:hypothetical protein FGB62_119g015 [Gracilaria domingensis]|nr:hypothetical protein FGB62_119g015 [Gracilaria domingensis]
MSASRLTTGANYDALRQLRCAARAAADFSGPRSNVRGVCNHCLNTGQTHALHASERRLSAVRAAEGRDRALIAALVAVAASPPSANAPRELHNLQRFVEYAASQLPHSDRFVVLHGRPMPLPPTARRGGGAAAGADAVCPGRRDGAAAVALRC